MLVILVLLTKMHGGNFGIGGFMPYGAKGVLSAVGSGGVMFAYLGFEQAGQFAGEARHPQRDVPWAIIGSVVISIILYLLLQVAFIGAVPSSQIAHDIAAVGNNGIVSGGFIGLMGAIGLGSLAFLLRVNAVISPAGTGLIYTGATAKASYGLARSRYVPAVFSQSNQQGVPSASLVIAFVLGLLFMLPSPRWSNVVALLTSASALMYAGAPLALGSFRRQFAAQPRPYRMPAANVLAPVAFSIANLIIYWSGWNAIWRLGVAIIVGYIAIGLTWLFSRPTARPPGLETGPMDPRVPNRHGNHLPLGRLRRRDKCHWPRVGCRDCRHIQLYYLLLGDAYSPVGSSVDNLDKFNIAARSVLVLPTV